jgi:hypothetical protein
MLYTNNILFPGIINVLVEGNEKTSSVIRKHVLVPLTAMLSTLNATLPNIIHN